MPVRGENEARFQRKRAADRASCLPDEVARGIHGSFTGKSGRRAQFSAIGRSFTGKVALGRCEGSTSPPPWQALGPSAGGRARAFPAGLCAGDAVRASGGPILAFAERSGCGQDSVPPTTPQRVAASRERPASQRVATSRERPQAPSQRRHLPPLSKGRRNRQRRNAPCRNRLSDDWRGYGRDIRTCGRRGILHLQ